tara:strand:+ start:355 stop:486 length:132 start_codon:yes stop_codon:yes gene_type:complete
MENKKQETPKLTPKFIQDNNLWDSIWLMKKYPEYHKVNNKLNK